ncbi:MAG: DNA translocase FtsK 4TM domain-containing protein [Candidatus Berkelbacteria bacterium]|nr:DNA translocase FtsK 4TM domain-containing protein [Candidatus Berkelbacteria bacterium]
MPLLRRKRRYQRKKKVQWEIDPDTAREIIAIVLIVLGIIFILSLLGLAGHLGEFLAHLITLLFGFLAIIFSLALLVLGIMLFLPEKFPMSTWSAVGVTLFFLFFPALFHLFIGKEEALEVAKAGKGGGIVGFSVSTIFYSLLGFWASFLIIFCASIISIMVIFSLKFSSIISFFGQLFRRTRGNQGVEVKNNVPVLNMRKGEEEARDASKLMPGEYQLPPISLLEDPSGAPTSGDINKNLSIIAKTLSHFGISVTMSDVSIGPTVTQYTLKPAEGVKLSQITARANDLSLALAAHPIRMEAPIPGKAFVGVEVPNQKRATVTLKEVLLSNEWKESKCKLPIALGRDVAGHPIVVNLEKMPHLLVAGSTGSGKTIFLNSLILSLLYTKKPNELKFILIDPKRVEFTPYGGLPNLLSPVVVDHDKIISTLKWTVSEMERRYKIFQDVGKRDIDVYNQSQQEKMPYVVVIIDELADLMALAASEVEAQIVRIAQMARATGIHLVVATQRPSVDVITGLIKANITARVAFAVASQVDSRTILDMGGADKLLGCGDMLYQSSDIAKPRRIQAPLIKEKEIKGVAEFIKAQAPDFAYEEKITEFKPQASGFGEIPKDEMYDQAIEVVTQAKKASASLLQRRLRIGYTRAARLLDLLEQNRVIGPADGAKPRDVLISKQEENPHDRI